MRRLLRIVNDIHACASAVKKNLILSTRGSLLLRMDEPVEIPINGVLDLHTFNPRDVRDLVPDYLAECQKRGILRVRIIHGKGIGNLRRTVHSILSKHPEVISFTLDHPEYGGWGATIVTLRSRAEAQRDRADSGSDGR